MDDQNLSEEEGHETYFDDETNDDEFSRPEGSAVENTPVQYDETSQHSNAYQDEPNYVEYTGEEAEEPAKLSSNSNVHKPRDNKICPIDSTLWMSDIDEKWEQDFIKKCFEHFDYYPKNIKVINDKAKSRPYAFIEFENADVARKALLKVNGRTIPNDPDRRKFHLSYANLPNQIILEYCLTVSNLSSSITDADLFRLFATKYTSCRGAKIHVHPDGSSKGFGIVKFHNQTDQQLALVELNKHSFKGKEIYLRLAPTKTRGPKNLIVPNGPFGQQNQQFMQQPGMYPPGFPGYGAGNIPGFNNPYTNAGQMERTSFGSRRNQGERSDWKKDDRRRRSRSKERRSRRRSRSTSKERKRRYWRLDKFIKEQKPDALFEPIYYPPYVEDDQPWPVDEYNEEFIRQSEHGYMDLISGKFSDFIVAPNWKLDDVVKHLYPEALIPST